LAFATSPDRRAQDKDSPKNKVGRSKTRVRVKVKVKVKVRVRVRVSVKVRVTSTRIGFRTRRWAAQILGRQVEKPAMRPF
jgi:hypothetical protein